MNPSEINSFRGSLSKIVNIPDDAWKMLEPHLEVKEFTSKSYLVEAGEFAPGMFYLLKGFVRVFFCDADGNEYTKAFRLSGELAAPYTSLILNEKSKLNIQSCVHVRSVFISYALIRKLFDLHPVWNHLGRKLAELIFIEREQREWEFLTLKAQERYENFLSLYASIKNDIPQYQIASYLGISPVSLSRIIGQNKGS